VIETEGTGLAFSLLTEMKGALTVPGELAADSVGTSIGGGKAS